VDYYETDSLTDRLDNLRLRIINELNIKSSRIAFEVMLEFLDLHEKTLNRVDDSNGTVSDVFSAACEDLGKILQTANHLSVTKVINLVFELFMSNSYGIYDDIIHNLKISLGTDGLDLLQEKMQLAANTNNLYKVKLALKNIADCKNNVDAFISACTFVEKPSAHDHLDIAKRLLTHWRAQEALEWLARMEIPSQHPWQQDKKKLKIQALELDGEYELAQRERLTWFEEILSPKIYGEILNASQPDFKEEFKLRSINKAFQFPEPHTAVHFLTQIQEFEEAAKIIRLRYDELSGKQYSILRPTADLLVSIDPLAATLLYRKMIQPILEETKTKYYSYAARDLMTCSALNSKIRDWDELQDHNHYFKEIEDKHKRKIRFWDEYKSAIQKQVTKEAKLAKNTNHNLIL